MEDITLCFIVKNELKGCIEDLPKIDIEKFGEVIAIDGGSNDGTSEYLKSQGIIVYEQSKPGLNNAYIQCNNIAKYDKIVTFFPKGTVDTDIIIKIIAQLKNGYDIVIASRQIKNSVNEEDNNFFKLRKWGVRILASLASIRWRKKNQTKIFDVLHGIKGWRRDIFNLLNIIPSGVTIDLEMVVKGYKNKLSMIEVPAKERPRTYGSTNFKLIPTSKKLLYYLVHENFKK